jgi:hypothetical protein
MPRQNHRWTHQLDTQWIRTLAENPFLSLQSKSALASAATLFFGKSVNDSQVILEGQLLYTKTIRMLQKAINDEPLPSTGTLCTVLMLGLFEVGETDYSIYKSLSNNSSPQFMGDSTPDGWLRHIHGAEQIVELRGPYQCVSGIENQMFLYFRIYGVCHRSA